MPAFQILEGDSISDALSDALVIANTTGKTQLMQFDHGSRYEIEPGATFRQMLDLWELMYHAGEFEFIRIDGKTVEQLLTPTEATSQ